MEEGLRKGLKECLFGHKGRGRRVEKYEETVTERHPVGPVPDGRVHEQKRSGVHQDNFFYNDPFDVHLPLVLLFLGVHSTRI